MRALAKGGRRLKSAFDNALDLLTVCSIVVLRKSPGTLDLLTEAQVVQRFPRLRDDLNALYAAYDRLRPEDLRRVAAKYFQPSNETAIILETDPKK